MTFLLTLWEKISTSLWFVPALFTLSGILLAVAALQVRLPVPEGAPVWWLHSGNATDAGNLVATLLTSLVTMATLAISITIVVLTLAAQQLGPRLIRNFMADKRTQCVIGLFFASILYLVLVLRSLRDSMPDSAVPHLAVTLGTVLMLLCVLALLYFVHHLAHSIISDTMIQRVGHNLDAAIRHMLLPSDGTAERNATEDRAEPPADLSPPAPVSLPQGGYVQGVNYEHLCHVATEAGALLELDFHAGHHLLANGCHVRVYPADRLDDDLREAVVEGVVVGAERTAHQDLEYSIRQLVEVAVRALSPGVNDPFTAIAVIDRLGRALALAMRQGPPQRAWYDGEGRLRVLAPAPGFLGLLDASFNQIRQAGQRMPSVILHLLSTLALLAELAPTERHRRALRLHVEMVARAGRHNMSEPHDLEALEERKGEALRHLER